MSLSTATADEANPETLQLSLAEAIERGLKYNLRLFLSQQDTRLARAERYRSQSDLLPFIESRIEEIGQQNNMKAFGLPGFPGVSPILGPFSFYDARVEIKQPVLNVEALRKHRPNAQNLKASQLSQKDARGNIVLAVTDLYLQEVADRTSIASALVQQNTAQALYKQAVDSDDNTSAAKSMF